MQAWQYQPMMWDMHGTGWLLGLLVIAALVAVIIALVRGLESRPDVGGRTAKELLDKRYAAGKISFEEYEESRQRLARAH